MAAEVRKTNQLAKLGARVAKAHEAHKSDETKYGMVDLPAGIKGGLARLAMAKIDEYKEDKPKMGVKKGDLYAIFRGIAITPERHDGQVVKGQGVTLTVPLCDTSKTKDGQVVPTPFEENWANFLNELRKFGLNTAAIPHTAVEATLLSLEQSKPVFKFSTRGWTPPKTASDPNPKEMVFTQYDGVVSAEEAHIATASAPASGFAAPEGEDESNDDQQGEALAAGEDFNLATIAAKAETGDMSAIELMKDKARSLGITDDEIDDSKSWDNVNGDGTSLAEMILAKQVEGGESSEVPDEPAWEPKAGATCNYQIKAGGKVHQVKIDKIDKKTETATVTNLADKKKIEKVPFAKLSAA